MTEQNQNIKYMTKALELAQKACDIGEVPVGALVVFHDGKEQKIVGQGYNLREKNKDPLAHAEILAIQEASQKLNRWRLSGCTLYVTLEPCCMCAGALVNSRIDKLVYGAKDPKAGGIESKFQIGSQNNLNHQFELESGVMAKESANLLIQFFKELRAK